MFVAALKESPKGTVLVVAGDLNTALDDPENDRKGTEIAAALTEAVLEDMTAHLLPRQQRWGRERRTWSMVREGKLVRSRTDYILGTDRSLFWNVSVRDRLNNTDHFHYHPPSSMWWWMWWSTTGLRWQSKTQRRGGRGGRRVGTKLPSSKRTKAW